MRAGILGRSLYVCTRERIVDVGQGAEESPAVQKRAAKRKGARGHEDPHATDFGADLEQLGRFALFCAVSALRGLT
jgi:hypothetical protein